jgi:predicted ester cyclase
MLGDVPGQSAFRHIAASFLEGIPDLRETVVDQIGEGDRVATRLTGSGTHRGPLMGIAGSGALVRWSAVVISRFAADGRVAEEWVEADFLSFATQLGAVLQTPARQS